MKIVGWVDDISEIGIAEALEKASRRSSLDIHVLTAAAFQEGLNSYINNIYYSNPQAPVSGYNHLGMDTFGDRVAGLRQQGYLRRDFQEGREYTTETQRSEKGATVHPGNFPSLDLALEGMAAMLKQERDRFRRDARAMGIMPTPDQETYWTYLYYNCGESRTCSSSGWLRLQKGEPLPKAPSGVLITTKDPAANAARVRATALMLKRGKAFS